MDYCLSFSPPKAMVITHKHHYLGASVIINRAVDGIEDIEKFRVIGYGDYAGFHATANINLFSSDIEPIGAQAMSQGVVFRHRLHRLHLADGLRPGRAVHPGRVRGLHV